MAAHEQISGHDNLKPARQSLTNTAAKNEEFYAFSTLTLSLLWSLFPCIWSAAYIVGMDTDKSEVEISFLSFNSEKNL